MKASSSLHMLQSASQVHVSGGAFIGTQNNATPVKQQTESNTKLVYNNVSWNAILNAGGRADAVRCHPGTRAAVMSEVVDWIRTAETLEKRVFWLSGPAGAGKSAISQTIAERCLSEGIPMANFFFFRTDTTRNTAAPLVATILYQLFDLCPAIKSRIGDILEENFFLFGTPIEQQIKTLVLQPLVDARQVWTGRQKIVLILDGLDECASESTQGSILRALYELATHKNSPFILFISSRAEHHLTQSFNMMGGEVARIYLDGTNFSSSDDIRLFVVSELEALRAMHPLASSLLSTWPTTEDIEFIVTMSSGHFIYAATVLRYIKASPESPALSLETVKGLRPSETRSPFSQLDAVYTYILAQCRHWPEVRFLLAIHMAPDQSCSKLFPAELGYSMDEIRSYTSDLTSLLQVVNVRLKFYHASFRDFLLDKARSGDFWINTNYLGAAITDFYRKRSGKIGVNPSWSYEKFWRLNRPDAELTHMILKEAVLFKHFLEDETALHEYLLRIEQLYSKSDQGLYEAILRKYLTWWKVDYQKPLSPNILEAIQLAAETWMQVCEGDGKYLPQGSSSGSIPGRSEIAEKKARVIDGSKLERAIDEVARDEKEESLRQQVLESRRNGWLARIRRGEEVEEAPQPPPSTPIEPSKPIEPSPPTVHQKSANQGMRRLIATSMTQATIQELADIRHEADSLVSEIAIARAQVVHARMDLEAAHNEAAAARAETWRQTELAQRELHWIRQESGAVIAEANARRSEARMLQHQTEMMRGELQRLREERARARPWWAFLGRCFS